MPWIPPSGYVGNTDGVSKMPNSLTGFQSNKYSDVSPPALWNQFSPKLLAEKVARPKKCRIPTARVVALNIFPKYHPSLQRSRRHPRTRLHLRLYDSFCTGTSARRLTLRRNFHAERWESLVKRVARSRLRTRSGERQFHRDRGGILNYECVSPLMLKNQATKWIG